MLLIDFLPLKVIQPELQAQDGKTVLRELAFLLKQAYEDLDEQLIARSLEEREVIGSTGMGSGIAIPHAKIKGLKKVVLAMGRTRKGIDFGSIDGEPVHLFFAIAAPEASVGVHLALLARLNKILGIPALQKSLLAAEDAAEIRRLIDSADRVA
jgi:nitrogen PTS system EIIA component